MAIGDGYSLDMLSWPNKIAISAGEDSSCLFALSIWQNVRRWGEYSLMRWVQGQRSKIKGQRLKSEGSKFKVPSHQPSLSAIAISCICHFLLHPLVIISTFLSSLYFIRRERFVTGGFMHIYTICKGQKTETGKCVCTRAADRVHTVGGVSSDTLL